MIKFWQNCTCLRASVCACIKNGTVESSRFSSFRILFCVVSLLACNFQCVLFVDSNCTDILVCFCNIFLFYVFLLLMLVTRFLSQKSIFGCQFAVFFLIFLKLLSSCIALVSDSKTAFLRYENCFLIFFFCLLIFFFLSVCLSVLIYLIVCLCGVITKSNLSSLIKQLCNIIVYLFPKLSLDIRFRMMDAISALVISIVFSYFLQFFVVSLILSVSVGLERKAYIDS